MQVKYTNELIKDVNIINSVMNGFSCDGNSSVYARERWPHSSVIISGIKIILVVEFEWPGPAS